LPSNIASLGWSFALPNQKIAILDGDGERFTGIIDLANAHGGPVKRIHVAPPKGRGHTAFLGGAVVNNTLVLLDSECLVSVDLTTYEASTLCEFPPFVELPAGVGVEVEQRFFSEHPTAGHSRWRVTYAAGKFYFYWDQKIFAIAPSSPHLQLVAVVPQKQHVVGIASTSGRLFILASETSKSGKRNSLTQECSICEVHPQDGTVSKLLGGLSSNCSLAVLRDPATPDLPIPEPQAQFFNTK
jgi:hypothetical protein